MDVELPVSRALQHRYQALVSSGEISEDPIQIDIVCRLDALNERLSQVRLASKKSALGWLFGKKNTSEPPVKGLYVWGGVGRGKTMLMDLFMEVAVVKRKRRAHFHEFMAETHERIHAWRQALKKGDVKGDDPIPPVAAQIAEETRLLCFDEFSVTDIADAMLLGRLFTQLFSLGVVVVATSNVEPENLYRDGLNRQLFLPFIALLQDHVDVVMLDSPTDYRLTKLGGQKVYLSPLGKETETDIEALWARLTHGVAPHTEQLEHKGRRIDVCAVAAGCARFSFDDLCMQPLGAADYLRVAQAYGTVFLENVPVMSRARRNEAKRFINLIDTLYDNDVRLVISAQAEPHELYQSESGTEAFEFDRTVSRLIEMRSEAYLSNDRASVSRGS